MNTNKHTCSLRHLLIGVRFQRIIHIYLHVYRARSLDIKIMRVVGDTSASNKKVAGKSVLRFFHNDFHKKGKTY